MKLHVPGPDGPARDLTAFDEVLFVSAAICLMFVIGVATWIAVPDVASGAEIEGPETHDDPRIAKGLKKKFEFGKMSDKKLQTYTWDAESQALAFEFGPREASEAACEHLGPALESAKDTAIAALVQTIEERTDHAPWTCLSRHFLDGSVSDPDGELYLALEAFWSELEGFEMHELIASTIVADFRVTRVRPESERFYSWLRLCGLNFEYRSGPECRRLLRQISPMQGEDMLMTAEKHVHKVELSALELRIIVNAVGEFANGGQPALWRVTETPALPAYDIDFRQGAVFMLCRFVNSPDQQVARQAANHLSRVAEMTTRSVDPNLVDRWRHACRLGFHGLEEDKEAFVPSLAVWTGVEDEPPNYSLAWAIERGDCEDFEDRPHWFCGADKWTAEGKALPRALLDMFLVTRHLEW